MKEQKRHRDASRTPTSTLLLLAGFLTLLAGLQSTSMAGKPTSQFFKSAPKDSNTALTHSGRAPRPFKNPIIFLHGSMGSHLVEGKSGRRVWGEFSERAANEHDPAAVRGLALPMRRGKSLAALRDTTYHISNLKRVGISVVRGVRLNVAFYEGAMERFGEAAGGSGGSGGGRYLEFSYDWRRSCAESAADLARFIEAKKAEFVRVHGYSRSMKFDFIAHSQGALVLRYYLRYGGRQLPRNGSLPRLTWAGARHAENIVFLGGPHAGVPEILEALTDGHRAKPLFPRYEAALIGTAPSIYQMLPRAKDGALLDPKTRNALNPLDYELWIAKQWGLANPEQDAALQVLLPGVPSARERRAIALDHLKKCLANAAQFQAALDRPARIPRHLHLTSYAGDAKKTARSYLAHPRKLKLHRKGKGDGLVPSYSAIRCAADETCIFSCTHNGLACKKKLNRHVIAALRSDQ